MKSGGINLESVKIRNKRAILELLLRKGCTSRKDIAKTISLTQASVTGLCGELITEGILQEKGKTLRQQIP